MSIQETSGDFSSNLTQSLITSESDQQFEQLSEKITENLESLEIYISLLEDYNNRLGTKDDTKAMRIEIKDVRQTVERIMANLGILFDQFDTLNKNNGQNNSFPSKFSRRSQLSFGIYKERYSKLLREIERKEKTYVQLQSPTIVSDFIEETKISDKDRIQINVKDVYFHVPKASRELNSTPVKKIIKYEPKSRKKAAKNSHIKSWDEEARELGGALERMTQDEERERSFSQRKEIEENIKEKSNRTNVVSMVLLAVLTIIVVLLIKGPFQVVEYNSSS